jgi:hypothetical protein
VFSSQSPETKKEKKERELFPLFFFFFVTGSGAYPPRPLGRGRGWETESLPVLNMGPESETGSRSPGDSYLEMGGVCLAARLRGMYSRIEPTRPGASRARLRSA